VLAELELETAALQEGLRRGELLSPVAPWHPPVLPPLPPELAGRVQALLDLQLKLQIELSLQLEEAPALVRPRISHRPDPMPMLMDLLA
jgi:hypothetical protein